MAKYLANITINKSQRKITIELYERDQNNDKLFNVVKYQCKDNEEFSKKLNEIELEYANYDQQIHWED